MGLLGFLLSSFMPLLCILLHNFAFNTVLVPLLGKADDKTELGMQEMYWGQTSMRKSGEKVEGAGSSDPWKDQGKDRGLDKKVLAWAMESRWSKFAHERSSMSCKNRPAFVFLLCWLIVWEQLMENTALAWKWQIGSRAAEPYAHSAAPALSGVLHGHRKPKPHTSDTSRVSTVWFSRTLSGTWLVQINPLWVCLGTDEGITLESLWEPTKLALCT